MRVTIGTYECNDSDVMAVVRAMQSGMLSTGKELDEFEKRVANRHNYKYGIMVNSGQSALEVALILAKVKLKKNKLKVIVPANTYAATLWAVINTGNEAIFCDIGKDYNIDWPQFGDSGHPNQDLKADVILAVDLCGKSTVPPKWIKDKYFIIEDACEAFGNKLVGYGDIVCFSFYVSHIITTGQGGMLCLRDKDLEDYGRSYIAHGRVFGGDFTKFKDKWVDRFLFDKVGVSYRSHNLSASLGLAQFSRIDEIIYKRRHNASILLSRHETLDEYFIFPSNSYHNSCIYQFFPILIKDSKINREHLLNYLFENGIDSRVLLSLTNQPIVKKLYGEKINYQYPQSHYVNDFGFIVGCHQNQTEKDMDYVLAVLRNYIPKMKEK